MHKKHITCFWLLYKRKAAVICRHCRALRPGSQLAARNSASVLCLGLFNVSQCVRLCVLCMFYFWGVVFCCQLCSMRGFCVGRSRRKKKKIQKLNFAKRLLSASPRLGEMPTICFSLLYSTENMLRVCVLLAFSTFSHLTLKLKLKCEIQKQNLF